MPKVEINTSFLERHPLICLYVFGCLLLCITNYLAFGIITSLALGGGICVITSGILGLLYAIEKG